MECVGINDLIKDRPNFRKIEDRKKRHLISCFHVGNKETLAFWDTFSDSESNRRKYAIRFNREYFVKLVESTKIADTLIPKIEKIVHGKVKYKNLINVEKTELSKKKVKYLAFRKEFVFAYEREYRFVIKLKTRFEQEGIALNVGFSKSTEFAILVNPLLQKEDYLKCQQLITDKGFSNKLEPSSLAKWLKPELW